MLKEIGAKAGVFDLVFIKPLIAGEVKTDTGGLSHEQKRFKQAFEAAGGKCYIWRSVTAMRDTLLSYGLECHNMTVFEPDLRSQEKKFQDARAYFARPNIQPDSPAAPDTSAKGYDMAF